MVHTGPEVIALQQRLNTEGAGLEVDGDYGEKTAAAVTAWDRRTRYALATIAEGRRRNITPRGIQIGLSVPFVETEWKIYANSKVPESLSIPHDAVGTDHDSVGIWQQRCPMWGPAHVLMDPTLSAGLFFDRLVKVNFGTVQAPIRYDNPSRLPGDFAAEVQRPAAQYRSRYQERMGHALALYNRLADYRPPTDELEDLLTMKIQSRSPYATPGELPVDAEVMIATSDMVSHRILTEEDARDGDPDAIRRLARTAAGLGKDPTPARARRATRILNEINAANPEYILAATPGKA